MPSLTSSVTGAKVFSGHSSVVTLHDRYGFGNTIFVCGHAKIHPNRIREFRESARLSMQALADRAGTSAPQINKLEKGERKLTSTGMIRLGRALNVDPKDLMVIEPMSDAEAQAGGPAAAQAL